MSLISLAIVLALIGGLVCIGSLLTLGRAKTPEDRENPRAGVVVGFVVIALAILFGWVGIGEKNNAKVHRDADDAIQSIIQQGFKHPSLEKLSEGGPWVMIYTDGDLSCGFLLYHSEKAACVNAPAEPTFGPKLQAALKKLRPRS